MSQKLRLQAAEVLDLTTPVHDRGPRTLQARTMLAEWLDTGRGDQRRIRPAIRWLRHVVEVESGIAPLN